MPRLCCTAACQNPRLRLPGRHRTALAWWLLLTAAGAAALARLELARLHDGFETDARMEMVKLREGAEAR